MRRVSITEAKNTLSALLDRVRAGETIVITDRDVGIAQLAPLNGSPYDTDEDRIARLVRKGLAVPPKRDPREVWAELDKMPRARARESVVEALLEERREGR